MVNRIHLLLVATAASVRASVVSCREETSTAFMVGVAYGAYRKTGVRVNAGIAMSFVK